MAVAFKEWEIVCAAMARGQQSIILRKGGIAEGREGFAFLHPEFFLFPTLFHEQAGKVRPEFAADFEPPPEGADAARPEIGIELLARVDFRRIVADWERVRALAPFHIWREGEIRKRFDWDEAPGISLAFVRVYRRSAPWCLANARSYGGCRSWVNLPEPPAGAAMAPVLGEEAHGRLRVAILAAIGE